MSIGLTGVVRRIARVSGEQPLPLDEFGNVPTSNALPAYARLAAAGKLYSVNTHAGTAKAPVTAFPTTSPEWALYNHSDNETLVVLQAAISLISGTAGLGLSIAGAVAVGAQTAVTADYASSVKTALDGSAKVPDFYVTNNPTLINTPSWFPFEGTKVNSVATNSVADTLVANIDGALIAKPNGGMVAFEAVGETGSSALFSFSAIVAMLELDRY